MVLNAWISKENFNKIDNIIENYCKASGKMVRLKEIDAACAQVYLYVGDDFTTEDRHCIQDNFKNLVYKRLEVCITRGNKYFKSSAPALSDAEARPMLEL